MLKRIDALRDWVDYTNLRDDFQTAGMSTLFENLINPSFKPKNLIDIAQRSLLEVWLDWVFGKEQVLGQFRGQNHEQLIRVP